MQKGKNGKNAKREREQVVSHGPCLDDRLLLGKHFAPFLWKKIALINEHNEPKDYIFLSLAYDFAGTDWRGCQTVRKEKKWLKLKWSRAKKAFQEQEERTAQGLAYCLNKFETYKLDDYEELSKWETLENVFQSLAEEEKIIPKNPRTDYKKQYEDFYFHIQDSFFWPNSVGSLTKDVDKWMRKCKYKAPVIPWPGMFVWVLSQKCCGLQHVAKEFVNKYYMYEEAREYKIPTGETKCSNGGWPGYKSKELICYEEHLEKVAASYLKKIKKE